MEAERECEQAIRFWDPGDFYRVNMLSISLYGVLRQKLLGEVVLCVINSHCATVGCVCGLVGWRL